MSSEKFEDHEEEFKTIIEALERTIKTKLPKLAGGKEYSQEFPYLFGKAEKAVMCCDFGDDILY